MMCRADIKKAIINELSEEFTDPVKAFSDTFLRKNGFKAITKNDSKRFKDAVEWRFLAWPVSRASALPRTTERVAGPVPTEALLICCLRALSKPFVSEFTCTTNTEKGT